MLQWPYCSARKNGTIPQYSSFPSSLSSRILFTTALSHSLLHIYSCVRVPVSVCVSFTSTSVHTHILSTSGKTWQKSHPLRKNPHITSFTTLRKAHWQYYGTVMVKSYDDIYHGIYMLLQGTPKGLLKQWNLSCKCLNSSFYCCRVWPDSI